MTQPKPSLNTDSMLGSLHGSAEGHVAPPSIGELIRDARNLSADDLERISQFQREHNMRFGEAAIALGLADTEDVLQALSQQFGYAVAGDTHRQRLPELVTLNQPFGHQAEAFRCIRSQYLLHTRDESPEHQRHPLAVVSTVDGEGKTFFAANIAVTLAQLGGRVLVVDADLRQSRMHKVFGVDNSVGLSTVLSGRGGKGVIQSVSGIGNLFVIPVGPQPPNPLELVEGTSFGLLMREVNIKFDHVIVDTPASQVGMDAVVIAARCGSALLVARRNRTKMAAVRSLVTALESAQVQMTGVIMNDF